MSACVCLCVVVTHRRVWSRRREQAAQFPRVDVSKLGVTAIEASDKSRSVYLEVM